MVFNGYGWINMFTPVALKKKSGGGRKAEGEGRKRAMYCLQSLKYCDLIFCRKSLPICSKAPVTNFQ